MAAPIAQAQIHIVKSTVPALKAHGEKITTLFYKNMLEKNPDLKNYFSITSQADGSQPRALAQSVLAYATYIDDLPMLKHAVERIAHKHASLFIKPDQYPIVGKHLLEAIREVLGPAATDEIIDAWTAAYGVLADVFIQREAQLYKDNLPWQGWRSFKIAKKIHETDNVISLQLKPSDGGKLPMYLPGQYVSLQLKPPQLDFMQSRQYSLSSAPRPDGDYYQISVKRDDGHAGTTPPGMLSNMLHNTIEEGAEVELSHPQGEFFVDPADTSKTNVPLVLISTGIGASPLLSILDAVACKGSRPIAWIQAGRDEAQLPFVARVKEIAAANKDTIRSSIFVEVPSDSKTTNVAGFATGHEGKLALDKLDREKELMLDHKDTQYFVCGPEPWMVALRNGLVDMGVDRKSIHLELFKTGTVED